jgi:hypothetical protein
MSEQSVSGSDSKLLASSSAEVTDSSEAKARSAPWHGDRGHEDAPGFTLEYGRVATRDDVALYYLLCIPGPGREHLYEREEIRQFMKTAAQNPQKANQYATQYLKRRVHGNVCECRGASESCQLAAGCVLDALLARGLEFGAVIDVMQFHQWPLFHAAVVFDGAFAAAMLNHPCAPRGMTAYKVEYYAQQMNPLMVATTRLLDHTGLSPIEDCCVIAGLLIERMSAADVETRSNECTTALSDALNFAFGTNLDEDEVNWCPVVSAFLERALDDSTGIQVSECTYTTKTLVGSEVKKEIWKKRFAMAAYWPYLRPKLDEVFGYTFRPELVSLVHGYLTAAQLAKEPTAKVASAPEAAAIPASGTRNSA